MNYLFSTSNNLVQTCFPLSILSFSFFEIILIFATAEDVPRSFDEFIQAERDKALNRLTEEENLNRAGLDKVVSDYLFTEREPLNDDIVGILKEKPRLLQRKSIVERIKDKIIDFVETFINGIPEVGE